MYLDFSTLTNQVFGFTASGQVIANVNLTYENATNADQLPKCIGAVALCEASEAFVRDPSYQRRQASGVLTSLHKDFADFACDNDLVPTGKIGRCVSEQLCVGDKQYRFGTVENGLDPNHLYYLGAAACVGATPPSTDLDKKYIRLKGDAAFSNPSELFPELGYEEMLFPVLSGLATALLASLLLVELIGLVTAKYKSLKISNLVYIVCTATLLKNMAAALTFLYFWLLAQSGERQGWYLYTRLVISSLADVAYIIVVVGMSAGFGLIPPNWFVSGRSPVIVIYIGVTLQILIVIAVKLMFPFQYLGTSCGPC